MLTDADHRLLALWAAACAEHVLHHFESVALRSPTPRSDRADPGMGRRQIRMSQSRAAGGHAMAAARASSGAGRLAAYAAGQAAVVAHEHVRAGVGHHVDPRRERVQRERQLRYLQNEQRADHLRPRRPALRRSADGRVDSSARRPPGWRPGPIRQFTVGVTRPPSRWASAMAAIVSSPSPRMHNLHAAGAAPVFGSGPGAAVDHDGHGVDHQHPKRVAKSQNRLRIPVGPRRQRSATISQRGTTPTSR